MVHFPVPKGPHSFFVLEAGFKFAAHRGGQQPGCSSQRKGHTQLQGSKVPTHPPEIPKPSPCSRRTARAAPVCSPGHCCRDAGSSTEAFPMSPTTYSGFPWSQANFTAQTLRLVLSQGPLYTYLPPGSVGKQTRSICLPFLPPRFGRQTHTWCPAADSPPAPVGWTPACNPTLPIPPFPDSEHCIAWDQKHTKIKIRVLKPNISRTKEGWICFPLS